MEVEVEVGEGGAARGRGGEREKMKICSPPPRGGERENESEVLQSLHIFQLCLNLVYKQKKCISRESNPGHIDGNDVFYH